MFLKVKLLGQTVNFKAFNNTKFLFPFFFFRICCFGFSFFFFFFCLTFASSSSNKIMNLHSIKRTSVLLGFDDRLIRYRFVPALGHLRKCPEHTLPSLQRGAVYLARGNLVLQRRCFAWPACLSAEPGAVPGIGSRVLSLPRLLGSALQVK